MLLYSNWKIMKPAVPNVAPASGVLAWEASYLSVSFFFCGIENVDFLFCNAGLAAGKRIVVQSLEHAVSKKVQLCFVFVFG